jgi:hypothetical protein
MTQATTDIIEKVLSLDGPAALVRKREVEGKLSVIKGDMLRGDHSRSELR